MSVKNDKIRELSSDEIHKQLNDAQHELMNLRFQLATGELTDFTRLRITRRQISRLITLLHERDTQAEVGD